MPAAAEVAINVRHLRKVYPGDVGALDISFRVSEGEIFGLLGPNGSGKTTAVECIGGLRVRDGGDVDVLGYDPADDQTAMREVVGIQPQESLLPDKIRVVEALDLFAQFYRDPALSRGWPFSTSSPPAWIRGRDARSGRCCANCAIGAPRSCWCRTSWTRPGISVIGWR